MVKGRMMCDERECLRGEQQNNRVPKVERQMTGTMKIMTLEDW